MLDRLLLRLGPRLKVRFFDDVESEYNNYFGDVKHSSLPPFRKFFFPPLTAIFLVLCHVIVMYNNRLQTDVLDLLQFRESILDRF